MKILFLVIFINYIIFCVFCNSSFAYRPFTTDDTSTIKPRQLNAETNTNYLSYDTEKEYALKLTLATGLLTDRLDAEMEIPYFFLDPKQGESVNGFGDVRPKLKYRLINETETSPALAVSTSINTTTGHEDKELGLGRLDAKFNFIAAKTLNKISLYANAGYTYICETESIPTGNTFDYGFALDLLLKDKLHAVGEINGSLTTESIDTDTSSEFLIGSIYDLYENSHINAGIGFGLTQNSPDIHITAGITHEF